MLMIPGKGNAEHGRARVICRLVITRVVSSILRYATPIWEINYNNTQFLTGHRGCRQYLYMFQFDNSHNCPNCDKVPENSGRFKDSKATPEDVVRKMPTLQEALDAINTIIASIQDKLRKRKR